jgi:hypothetical protein
VARSGFKYQLCLSVSVSLSVQWENEQSLGGHGWGIRMDSKRWSLSSVTCDIYKLFGTKKTLHTACID